MDRVVVIHNPWHKLCLSGAAASQSLSQFGAQGQSQPLEDEVEFPAEASVYPEVEDAVEEAVGGWQPDNHKLDPLRYSATGDCCGVRKHGGVK